MRFVHMMVKLFRNQSMPEGIYFKYAQRYYLITSVSDEKVSYTTDDGDRDFLRLNSFDYNVRSVVTNGSRIVSSSRRVVIDIGGGG